MGAHAVRPCKVVLRPSSFVLILLPLPLAPHSRLGPYLVLAPLGAGGMGEVYKATDTRLDRLVAIKTLRSELATDPERRLRFEREARAVAALSHPHICTLHDVGRQDGIEYLVMELLDGDTLAARLGRGPMPLPEALACATQIAQGLAAAHRRGIIHRDLKPANVMLTRGGAKLLDFGLAKSPLEPGVVDGATETASSLTGRGEILGTLHYMAPEQLEGRPVDARTDVFAFGLILHEMVTGTRAFAGETPATLIGAILHTTPPAVSSVVQGSPPALDALIAGCLAKDPDERWSSGQDILLQLRAIATVRGLVAGHEVDPPSRSRERLAWTVAGIAGAAALALAVATAGRLSPVEPAATPQVYALTVPLGSRFDYSDAPQVSPDGRFVAFAASDEAGRLFLHVKGREEVEPRRLAETDDASMPFWSPDSRSIGYFASGQLKTIAVGGGAPQTLTRAPVPRGGTWTRDGRILFVPLPSMPLLSVPATGGPATPVPNQREGQVRWFPQILPDQRHYLYLGMHERGPMLFVGDLASDSIREIAPSIASAIYAEPGYLLMRREQALVAQRFDTSTFQLTGVPFVVQDRVGFNAMTYQALFSASDEGTLVSIPATPASQLTWFDADGRRVGPAAPAAQHITLCVTGDGRHVVYDVADRETANLDLWSLPTSPGGTPTRLTFDPRVDFYPVCAPDGSDVAFASLRAGRPNVFRLSLSAPGSETPIVQSPLPKIPTHWSRPGGTLLYSEIDPAAASWDIKRIDIGGTQSATVIGTDNDERAGRLSPDGRWLAYLSFETGRGQIYVQPMPATGARWQVTQNGGKHPQWSASGRELYYVAPEMKVMAVPVAVAGGAFSIGAPRILLDARLSPNDRTGQGCQYAVLADGRIIAITSSDAPVPATVTLNWASRKP
jgi:Tol biopolymer transport system component